MGNFDSANIKGKLISVIVPVYNAERYLCRCIESILNQTHRNIELILINDGSIDSSEEICQKYGSKDSRIRYVYQENRGTAVTRMRGIELSKGDFISFVDNDDYICPIMYEKMLSSMFQYAVDIVCCQWDYEFADKRKSNYVKNADNGFYGKHKSIEFYRKYFDLGGYVNVSVGVLWNKLYKRNLFHDVKVEYEYPEDQEINDQIYTKDVNIVVIPDVFYIYYQHMNNVTSACWPGKRLAFLDVLNKKMRIYKDKDIMRQTAELYCNIYIEYFFRAQSVHVELPPKYMSIFKKMVKYLLRMVRMKFLCRMFIFLMSPPLYKRLARI